MTQSTTVWGSMMVAMLFGCVVPAHAQAVAEPLSAQQLPTTFDIATQPLAVWMTDQPVRRPAGLTTLYATYGALQAFDVYLTRRALDVGAHEANPVMVGPARNSGVMLAVKALSTVGSIYFTERTWKKNRKGAVILMVALNAVSTAVVIHNVRNVRVAR
jgi:hypothetical protein